MNVETIDDLFEYQLEGMYYTETELVDALDELASETSNEELRQGFQEHKEETQEHVERLEAVFQVLGREPDTHENPVMDGLEQAKSEFTDSAESQEIKDLYFIGAGIKTERIEITGYEGLLQLAEQLDMGDEVTGPLNKTLEEEEETLDELQAMTEQEQIEQLVD